LGISQEEINWQKKAYRGEMILKWIIHTCTHVHPKTHTQSFGMVISASAKK